MKEKIIRGSLVLIAIFVLASILFAVIALAIFSSDTRRTINANSEPIVYSNE